MSEIVKLTKKQIKILLFLWTDFGIIPSMNQNNEDKTQINEK